MGPAAQKTGKDKQLIIAVDESESSHRAVLYVAGIIGGLPGFIATLITIIPDMEMDFFESEAEKDEWLRTRLAAADKTLAEYRRILIDAGFPDGSVHIQTCVEAQKSLAQAILEIQCDASCCTVVVGRGHKTKAEEFLFGSISSRLIHEAKSCAVWVVE